MHFNKYRILLVKLRLKLFYTLLLKIFILKFIIFNSEICNNIRFLLFYFYSFYFKLYLSIRLNCIVSGRYSALNRFFFYDRFVLRTFTNTSTIQGYARYSW